MGEPIVAPVKGDLCGFRVPRSHCGGSEFSRIAGKRIAIAWKGIAGNVVGETASSKMPQIDQLIIAINKCDAALYRCASADVYGAPNVAW
jgi:outer membrane lipoprotein SlyB